MDGRCSLANCISVLGDLLAGIFANRQEECPTPEFSGCWHSCGRLPKLGALQSSTKRLGQSCVCKYSAGQAQANEFVQPEFQTKHRERILRFGVITAPPQILSSFKMQQ